MGFHFSKYPNASIVGKEQINFMQELYLPGGNIYVRKNTFQVGRKTIIFIHGLSGSSSAWREYEDAFCDSYNILSYDIRGHGKSFRHDNYEDYDFSNFSDDLNYLVAYFSLDKFVLVAHSFGTFIAIDYLMKYGSRVEQCILLAPGFNANTRFLVPFMNISILTTRMARRVFHIRPKMSHVEYSPALRVGDWNIRRMTADIRNTGLLVYLYCMKQAIKVDYRERLHLIDCPTLVIHGKKDTVLWSPRGVKIHASLKNSKLVLLDEANHVLVFSHLNEITQHISDFIKKYENNSNRK